MDVYTALSASTRREIVELLAERGDRLSVSEIGEHFRISQSAISQHLKILHSADIITVERQGQRRLYEINHTTLKNLAAWAAKIGAQHKRFAKVTAKQKQKISKND